MSMYSGESWRFYKDSVSGDLHIVILIIIKESGPGERAKSGSANIYYLYFWDGDSTFHGECCSLSRLKNPIEYDRTFKD